MQKFVFFLFLVLRVVSLAEISTLLLDEFDDEEETTLTEGQKEQGHMGQIEGEAKEVKNSSESTSVSELAEEGQVVFDFNITRPFTTIRNLEFAMESSPLFRFKHNIFCKDFDIKNENGVFSLVNLKSTSNINEKISAEKVCEKLSKFGFPTSFSTLAKLLKSSPETSEEDIQDFKETKEREIKIKEKTDPSEFRNYKKKFLDLAKICPETSDQESLDLTFTSMMEVLQLSVLENEILRQALGVNRTKYKLHKYHPSLSLSMLEVFCPFNNPEQSFYPSIDQITEWRKDTKGLHLWEWIQANELHMHSSTSATKQIINFEQVPFSASRFVIDEDLSLFTDESYLAEPVVAFAIASGAAKFVSSEQLQLSVPYDNVSNHDFSIRILQRYSVKSGLNPLEIDPIMLLNRVEASKTTDYYEEKIWKFFEDRSLVSFKDIESELNEAIKINDFLNKNQLEYFMTEELAKDLVEYHLQDLKTFIALKQNILMAYLYTMECTNPDEEDAPDHDEVFQMLKDIEEMLECFKILDFIQSEFKEKKEALPLVPYFVLFYSRFNKYFGSEMYICTYCFKFSRADSSEFMQKFNQFGSPFTTLKNLSCERVAKLSFFPKSPISLFELRHLDKLAKNLKIDGSLPVLIKISNAESVQVKLVEALRFNEHQIMEAKEKVAEIFNLKNVISSPFSHGEQGSRQLEILDEIPSSVKTEQESKLELDKDFFLNLGLDPIMDSVKNLKEKAEQKIDFTEFLEPLKSFSNYKMFTTAALLVQFKGMNTDMIFALGKSCSSYERAVNTLNLVRYSLTRKFETNK